jgi:hypothetical protein
VRRTLVTGTTPLFRPLRTAAAQDTIPTSHGLPIRRTGLARATVLSPDERVLRFERKMFAT